MKNNQRGLTLIELLIVVVAVGILLNLATASYSAYVERARVAKTIADLGEIHIAIQRFLTEENRGYPATLAELDVDSLVDPWGNPYQFLVIDGLGNNGAVRKDKNLVPVNQRYDLYSLGPDGRTETPFTSQLGRDDIVLAADGTYFGKAEDY